MGRVEGWKYSACSTTHAFNNRLLAHMLSWIKKKRLNTQRDSAGGRNTARLELFSQASGEPPRSVFLYRNVMRGGYEGGKGRGGADRERRGQGWRRRRPFFSGPVGTVGSGMGSNTLQSFPVWSRSQMHFTSLLHVCNKQTNIYELLYKV